MPPYPLRQSYMEKRLAFSLFYPVDCLATDGRPILEGRSFSFKPPEAEYRSCPYADSRRNSPYPMNSGALRSTAKNLPVIKEILKNFAYLLKSTKKNYRNDELANIWQLSYVCWSLPSAQHKCGLDISGAVADLSKLCHGIQTLTQSLFFEAPNLISELTAVSLYDHADKSGLLVGDREVCAAPASMITSLLQYILQTLPLSSPDALVKNHLVHEYDYLLYSIARWLMEKSSILYESVRFHAWKKSSTQSGFQQRFAIPYCRPVVSAFSGDNPLSLSAVVETLMRRKFSGSDAMIGDEMFVELAAISSRMNDKCSESFMWHEFDSAMLNILQHIEELLLRFYKKKHAVHHYSSNDLSIFFGEKY